MKLDSFPGGRSDMPSELKGAIEEGEEKDITERLKHNRKLREFDRTKSAS